MATFNTLDSLLGHIVEVEREMIELSASAHQRISEWINASERPLGDEVLEALQYQDILSQQLSATIEALESIRVRMNEGVNLCSLENSETGGMIETIDTRLIEVLEKARHKRSAFRGRSGEDEQGIEFF